MIDKVDRELENWTQALLEGVTVAFAPPEKEPGGEMVVFFLTELQHAQPARGGRLSLLELAARYLVAVWAKDPLVEHRILAELAFGAMRHEKFELELEAPPLGFWAAIGSRPRAAFHLRVPVRREMERPKAKPILEPVRLRQTKLGVWEGTVLGPGDLAVAAARVEFPSLGKSVTTDANGRFRLRGVPLETPPREARVHARGREFVVSASEWGDGKGTVTIRLQGLEV